MEQYDFDQFCENLTKCLYKVDNLKSEPYTFFGRSICGPWQFKIYKPWCEWTDYYIKLWPTGLKNTYFEIDALSVFYIKKLSNKSIEVKVAINGDEYTLIGV